MCKVYRYTHTAIISVLLPCKSILRGEAGTSRPERGMCRTGHTARSGGLTWKSGEEQETKGQGTAEGGVKKKGFSIVVFRQNHQERITKKGVLLT